MAARNDSASIKAICSLLLLLALSLSACTRLMGSPDGREADAASGEGSTPSPDARSDLHRDANSDTPAASDLLSDGAQDRGGEGDSAVVDLTGDRSAADLQSPDLCDTTPLKLGVNDVGNQPLDKVVVDPMNITGIDCPVVAEVSGNGNPTLRVNGVGAWAKTALVSAGDTLEARAITSPSHGVTRTVKLSVGSSSKLWRLTTCTPATCMSGSLGSNVGCSSPAQRVWRWRCPGSSAWIYARELTYQFSGTGLLACPPKATCEWQSCGGNGWKVGTLSCP